MHIIWENIVMWITTEVIFTEDFGLETLPSTLYPESHGAVSVHYIFWMKYDRHLKLKLVSEEKKLSICGFVGLEKTKDSSSWRERKKKLPFLINDENFYISDIHLQGFKLLYLRAKFATGLGFEPRSPWHVNSISIW